MSDELTQLSIPNVPAHIKERLELDAEQHDRSLASLMRQIILAYVAKLEEDAKAPIKPRQSGKTVSPQPN